MNIAASEPLERGKYLGEVDTKEYVLKMMAGKFNGYICVTIAGRGGIEEGVIVFHDGAIVSSDYEYFRYDKRFKADEGLKRSLNALCSKKGVIDSFSLSPYQVQLILTLNEDCTLAQKVMPETLAMPAAFSSSYEEQLEEVPAPKEDERTALLKKYGIVTLREPTVTKGALIAGAMDEHVKLEELLKKKAAG
jgi:hypothetical protein